jgi:hypothetical protein
LSPSTSVSPSASASASLSPSASVSPSPSQEIYGEASEITASKQVNSITITKSLDVSITIIKQEDDISILDTDSTTSGNTPIPDEVIITKQADSITITTPIDINIVVVD